MTAGSYALSDHLARPRDPYAAAKYRLTIEWLEQAGHGGDEIYNIGCGSGVFTEMAAAKGTAVRAFEPDPAARALAAARLPPRCTVEPLALSEITGQHVAAVIVMHDVLEHLADDSLAVAHLLRLLRPDGALILSVPAVEWLFGSHDRQLGHYRRYTKASLLSAINPYFEVTRIRYFGMTFIPLTLWVSRIRGRSYSTRGSGPLLRLFDLVCRLEQRIPSPIGTSLMCMARPTQSLDAHQRGGPVGAV